MGTRVYKKPSVQTKKRKKKFSWKMVCMILVILLLAYAALYLIVVPERPDQPFFEEDEGPLVIAHRGGASPSLSPENTLVAFDRAVTMGVDVIEFDVHLSKDGYLMVIHDETVERTTDGEGFVSEMTLEELQELDAAYHFRDVRGHYIYRGQDVRIPTVEEVFELFPDMRFNIEMKEPLEEEMLEAHETEHRLWEVVEEYDMHEQVLVSSFSEPMVQRFRELSQGRVAVSASQPEAQRFSFYHKLFLERLYRPQVDALQLPMDYGLISLTDQRIVQGAKRLNMPIHYWTVNEEEDMRELLELGVDGIITDRPDLLMRVMSEMEDKHEES